MKHSDIKLNLSTDWINVLLSILFTFMYNNDLINTILEIETLNILILAMLILNTDLFIKTMVNFV